jgi:thiamine biosynthesis lipoprotein
MRSILFCTALLFLSFNHDKKPSFNKYHLSGTAQGTTYHITYYAKDSIVVKAQIDRLLNEIDRSLSLYQPNSLVNRFNQSADGLVPDRHLKAVVVKAQEIFKSTQGLFDITIFPLTDAWGFGPQRSTEIPDTVLIDSLRSCVNSRLLIWEGMKLVKKKKGVQLDPNGIAQGYSVDILADFLAQKGVRNYIVELGGEIRVRGRKPGHQKMSVGIEAPGDDVDFSMIEKVIYPGRGAITTSGNYRRYYESKGQRISHLLDPRTGFPIANEMISVTVYAKDAITADGYDNAIMGMGLQEGLAFVERRKDLAAHFIYRRADGVIADTMSRRFRKLLRP